ncbi:MAG: hypothetical protein V4636_12905 [Pseudomonadota bacterium]
MILDVLDQVMSTYAPTAVAAAFEDYIDRIVKMENGSGNPIDVLIQVAAAVTSTGAATVQFQAIGNPTDPTFASGNIVLWDSGAIGKATLTAGYLIRGTIKSQAYDTLESGAVFCRYLTILVTIGTEVLSAGTFNGWFKDTRTQDNLSYPAGYDV